jgi:hypothetical protein
LTDHGKGLFKLFCSDAFAIKATREEHEARELRREALRASTLADIPAKCELTEDYTQLPFFGTVSAENMA